MNKYTDMFLSLAEPNKDGFSREVFVSEFVGEYAPLKLGNGGSWCRDDGSLGKRYNIVRKKCKHKIVSITLHGFKKNPINKLIPVDIRAAICAKKCLVTGINGVECDHKDGRRDNFAAATITDFQPLSKAANDAKRNFCKICRNTNRRFDATILGFTVPVLFGGLEYHGNCAGCYWFDVERFHRDISHGFSEDSI